MGFRDVIKMRVARARSQAENMKIRARSRTKGAVFGSRFHNMKWRVSKVRNRARVRWTKIPARDRIQKIRSRFRSQEFLQERQRGKRIGDGKVISGSRKRVDTLTARVKNRKPNILPSVDEALGKWNAGSRITEMLPTAKRRNKVLPQSNTQKAHRRQSSSDISLWYQKRQFKKSFLNIM